MISTNTYHPVVDFLNYQGTDLAKSLLVFSKGEKVYKSDIESINYLLIYGANCYGNGLNRRSNEEKLSWVDKNKEDIINFKNKILITKADNKILFTAFCFEYINYINSLNNNNSYFITHFPIQMDSTCNGYQHFSLLLGEDYLATQVNIINRNKKNKIILKIFILL